MTDLKKVYQALTIEEAEMAFEEFKEKWDKQHPIIIRFWENNWIELTTYFKSPYKIRRIIYATNPVEGYHRQAYSTCMTVHAYFRLYLSITGKYLDAKVSSAR